MAALELYYFEPNMSQTPNDGIEDSEVHNCLKKIDFADLVKDAKSVAAFSSSCQFQIGQNDVI